MPSLKFMRKRTSSAGRRQFSVENAYALDRVEQRFLTSRVTLRPLETSTLRPAAVAVHDSGNVGRDPVGVETRQLARGAKAGEAVHGLQATAGRVPRQRCTTG